MSGAVRGAVCGEGCSGDVFDVGGDVSGGGRGLRASSRFGVGCGSFRLGEGRRGEGGVLVGGGGGFEVGG